jgi:hypothetical protein
MGAKQIRFHDLPRAIVAYSEIGSVFYLGGAYYVSDGLTALPFDITLNYGEFNNAQKRWTSEVAIAVYGKDRRLLYLVEAKDLQKQLLGTSLPVYSWKTQDFNRFKFQIVRLKSVPVALTFLSEMMKAYPEWRHHKFKFVRIK